MLSHFAVRALILFTYKNVFHRYVLQNSLHAEMVVNIPFKRWAPMQNPWPDSRRTTLYRLETTEGQHVIAAVAIRTQTDQFVYQHAMVLYNNIEIYYHWAMFLCGILASGYMHG